MDPWRQADFLSRVGILERFPRRELLDLAGRCQDLHLNEGDSLRRAEDHDGELLFVKRGRLCLYKESPAGKRLTLAMVAKGQVLTSKRLRGLRAQAAEPTVLAVMNEEALKHSIRSNPELAIRLIDLLDDRLRLMDERMADLAYKEVPARLASLLLHLLRGEGVACGQGHELPSHYTHEQLGTMIGVKRVAVSRAFGRLRRAGAVKPNGRRIRVTDLEALEQVARGEK